MIRALPPDWAQHAARGISKTTTGFRAGSPANNKVTSPPPNRRTYRDLTSRLAPQITTPPADREPIFIRSHKPLPLPPELCQIRPPHILAPSPARGPGSRAWSRVREGGGGRGGRGVLTFGNLLDRPIGRSVDVKFSQLSDFRESASEGAHHAAEKPALLLRTAMRR